RCGPRRREGGRPDGRRADRRAGERSGRARQPARRKADGRGHERTAVDVFAAGPADRRRQQRDGRIQARSAQSCEEIRRISMRSIVTAGVLLFFPVLAAAQTRPSSPHIKRTNPPTLSKPTGYTHVVETVGAVKTVYIAGQVALDRDGNVVGSDMRAQAEQVFRNLEIALATAGAKFSDVVKMNTYATDLSQIAAYREVRAQHFGETSPASTLVQVVKLARPEFLLEVEVIAAVREGVRVVPATR